MFKTEKQFEDALVDLLLRQKGWQSVLSNPTEQDLIDNWARILFDNNRGIDRLNNIALTAGEMGQIVEQIVALKTPLRLNGFINGKTVSITRDNPADTLHFGKEIDLKIYDRTEIAAGDSSYQIVRQPKFTTKSKILNDRRGDLMLLINGMPVFHIELKKSCIPVSQATNQIEKYAHEGVFSGLFSLVQVFVAMSPEETVYFANPGLDGTFNPDYYFHWANFDNEPVNDWKDIASLLLSIPMAHQLIGFYTVADHSDGILKVMRSYQYIAANAISDRVTKIKWQGNNQYGGYVWHTTGSGKTMTSFKSAQLIANSKDADKVIFLVDRIELGTQSLNEYRGFADDDQSVQATESTHVLVAKLKSAAPADTLIVTSIQKMSNIKDDSEGLKADDIEKMKAKRIVFIVDEAHRSTFGDMLITIKTTFPAAIFFGFTGTPIHKENQKKGSTTSSVFGNELHRYSIADGIRDKNVLGFDPYKITTFRDRDLRKAVALEKAKANTEPEAIADEKKRSIYYKYLNDVKMAGYQDDSGTYHKGIEDYATPSQYNNATHREIVVQDIADNWVTLSRAGKFHAIFATNSIPEAIEYYWLIKSTLPHLKITALFDPTIDNMGGAVFKEDALVEVIEDYNNSYDQSFEIGTHAKLKKDIALRLAHKGSYQFIQRTPSEQIDLLIVVDQMLTGFDSKWINTLYLDKVLEHANIIQAFSRTNRLFGPEKPFGTIRYYRKPHTMERNIADAVKNYSGDKPLGLFVDSLPTNIQNMNHVFGEITSVFEMAGVPDFLQLPDDKSVCGKFAQLFKRLNDYLEAAKIQGFQWEQTEHPVSFDEKTYLILALRYKELFHGSDESGCGSDDVPYDIVGYLTEIDTGMIDSNYMNANFEKYLKLIHSSDQKMIERARDDLHKTFATLTQDEQKYANVLLNDIQRGELVVETGKTLRDYITEYQVEAKDTQFHRIAAVLGLDEEQLQKFRGICVTENNINEFGRFEKLINSVDKAKAKAYFEEVEKVVIPQFRVNSKVDNLLREFILKDGIDLVYEADCKMKLSM